MVEVKQFEVFVNKIPIVDDFKCIKLDHESS